MEEGRIDHLDSLCRRLALGYDGHGQATVWALQDELLVPPRAQEIRNAPYKNEPAHDHEHVREPIRRRDAAVHRHATTIARHSGIFGREVVAVGICRGAGEIACRRGGRTTGRGDCAFHGEAELDEGYAQAGEGAVLGGVRGVQEVGEQEANDLEGHGDHSVPDEGEDGADGQAVDVDFVRAAEAGREDGGFPVGWCRICCGLFIGLDHTSQYELRW